LTARERDRARARRRFTAVAIALLVASEVAAAPGEGGAARDPDTGPADTSAAASGDGSPDAPFAAPTPPSDRGRSRPDAAIDAGLRCDGRPDDADRVRHVLAEGPSATLWIPSGCRVVVPSPGAGRAAFVLRDGARVACEDATAGFALARRACFGGRVPGAHCRTSEDCAGGECREDLPGRGPFAPGVCATDASRPCTADGDCASGACTAPAAPYTLFAAAKGAQRVAIVGCSIDVRQTSRDEATGALYGTCDGGAAAGRACRQLCSGVGGGVEVACNSDADCAVFGFGSCGDAALCGAHPDGSGDCFEKARQPGSPAGPGPVRVIDFSAARDALVEDVWVWDHVYGDFSIALGRNGRLMESGVGLARSAGPSGAILGKGAVAGRPPWGRQDQHLGAAVVTGVQGTVAGSSLRGGAVAIRAGLAAIITGNNLTCADGGGLAYRTCGEDRSRPQEQRRTCEKDEECSAGCATDGPDCVGILVDGDQVAIVGNRIQGTFTGLASTPRGFNVTFSANRVTYGEGPKIAIAGSGWTVSDNYLAWGSRPENGPIVQLGRASAPAGASLSDHVRISGNLIFGDDGEAYRGLAHIGLAGGVAAGRHQRLVIADNTLLMKPSHVGVDLSRLAPATLGRSAVSGNAFFGGGVGIAFPADAALVTRVVVSGNSFVDTREPLRGFDWRMGDAIGNAPPPSEAPQLVLLRNGAAAPLQVGDALTVVRSDRPEQAGSVEPAPVGSKRVVGLSLDAAAPGAPVRVAVGGTARCRVVVGWLGGGVVAGDALAVGSEAGALASASDDEAAAVAVALEPTATSGEIRCLIR
jgi:hypothetical protein